MPQSMRDSFTSTMAVVRSQGCDLQFWGPQAASPPRPSVGCHGIAPGAATVRCTVTPKRLSWGISRRYSSQVLVIIAASSLPHSSLSAFENRHVVLLTVFDSTYSYQAFPCGNH